MFGQREREPDTAFPEFWIEAEPLPAESEKAGREICRDVEMVYIYTPGDRTSVPCHKVTDEHRQRWPAQYAAFKKLRTVAHEGTALEDWPRMTPSRIRELKAVNLFTVENVAGMNDAIIQRLGMGGRELWWRRRRLSQAQRTAPTRRRLAVENERMKLDMARQQQQIADLARMMEAMQRERDAAKQPPNRRHLPRTGGRQCEMAEAIVKTGPAFCMGEDGCADVQERGGRHHHHRPAPGHGGGQGRLSAGACRIRGRGREVPRRYRAGGEETEEEEASDETASSSPSPIPADWKEGMRHPQETRRPKLAEREITTAAEADMLIRAEVDKREDKVLALSLLQLCQRVARRVGVTAPSSVIGAAAAGLLHEVALETGEDLAKSHDWQVLRVRRAVAGAEVIPFAADHDRMAGPGQGELWDVTTTQSPANGPLDTYAWDSVGVQRADRRARTLLVAPRRADQPHARSPPAMWNTPTSRRTGWCWHRGRGLPTPSSPTADTTLFPDDVMRRGMRWVYLQTKGFAYEEALSDYERAKERAISRDRGPRVVDTAYPWTQGPGGYPDNFFAGTITVGGDGGTPDPLTEITILVDGTDVSTGNPLPVTAVP